MPTFTLPTQADLDIILRKHDDLHALVPIDKHALDDELATQAVKYRDVLDTLALTISCLAAVKDDFDQVEAELIQNTRDKHEEDHRHEEKPPRLIETACMAIVKQNPMWIDAKQTRRAWEDAHTKMSFLKETFAQRSSNMKELPVLYAAGYWVTNSSTGRPRGEQLHDAAVEERSRRVAARGEARDETPRRRPVG